MQVFDLPQDKNGQLSAVRSPLVKVINSAKHSESKRELLKATLERCLAELATYVSDEAVKAPVAKPATPKKRATAKVKAAAPKSHKGA